MSIRV